MPNRRRQSVLDPHDTIRWANIRVGARLRALDLDRFDGLDELGDDEELDEECRALLQAIHEWQEREHATRADWDPLKHPRIPPGQPGAGRFRKLVDRVLDAFAAWQKAGGKGDPFKGFDRGQLRKVALKRGITLRRGASRDDIAKALTADLTPGASKTPAKAGKATPAAPTMPRKAISTGSAKAAGVDDGLDDLDERRLKSLGVEFELDTDVSREKLIADLRAVGAISPEVRMKRNEARRDLQERLKTMGRRQPADEGPLDRAAASLANGDDVKAVAKALRSDADKTSSNEDAQTLRHLASDLTRKKAKTPEYINAKGNIDLRTLAEINGVDLKRWMPEDNPSKSGMQWYDYRDKNPFDNAFRYLAEALADPRPGDNRAKIIRRMRESAENFRHRRRETLAGRGPLTWPNRDKERKAYLDGALAAANDLERLADLAAAAKVPPKKRGVTLGGTTLGEVVQVDESRFRNHQLTEVVAHRGEKVPRTFRHVGFAAQMMKNPNRPHRPGLSPAESNALDLYTVAVVADTLNGSLRKGRNVHGQVALGNTVVDLDDVARDLDSAIADSTLTKDTILWRGSVPTKVDYRRLVPGAIYHEAGYFSTSTEEKGARYVIDWRKGKLPAGRQPVLFKILAPAGLNAALGHEHVKEAVLPRNQELRVVRVDESGDVPTVVMEAIPQKPEPGRVRGRSLLDDLDYDAALKARDRSVIVSQDHALGYIQKAQGFDGPAQVVTRERMDELTASGATELFRALRGNNNSAKYAEEFRSGPLFPGLGVYGSGTYSSPDRNVALRYGQEETMLRIALRRDARVIRYDELLKLRPHTGVTAGATKLAEQRQAELDAVDPADSVAVAAIIDKYAKLAARQGPRSQIGNDMGRVAALLGYDAIIVPENYRGRGSKMDGQPEYIILNRTATYVEEARP